MGETRRKKFGFRRDDGSLVGHGRFMQNRIQNMESSGQLDDVPSTRKPFEERYGGIGKLRVSG